AEEAPAKPKRSRRKKADEAVVAEPAPEAAPAEAEAAPVAAEAEATDGDTDDANADSGAPRRGGWWQRTFGA
ncbi:MAG: hypothetical protein EOP59_06075, partial [Sphingomonadales bacterium]